MTTEINLNYTVASLEVLKFKALALDLVTDADTIIKLMRLVMEAEALVDAAREAAYDRYLNDVDFGMAMVAEQAATYGLADGDF